MIRDQLYPFKRLIEEIQNAAIEQCRNLEYSDRFKEEETADRVRIVSMEESAWF
ncbi:MAG: hypothetical protein J2P21_24455 [Chloracidobacterium sp.]|nr:hypothetical protein [Chloracidobacterium sp.]